MVSPKALMFTPVIARIWVVVALAVSVEYGVSDWDT
jgi:hypothetical protein